ncbi:MAG: glycosyltransferase family 4 protein [Candidatus Udaeobacter sp.]
MRIAIDATYSVDPRPSGIAVYSKELLEGLIEQHADDEFIECFRLKQWSHRPRNSYPHVRQRLLQRPIPIGRADIFHALNQRVDWRPAKRVISTFHDLFVMTAEYSSPQFRKRFSEQARRAAEHSDAIIAVSQFTAEQVHSLLNVERSRIRVIPHGVHVPHTRPSSEFRRKTILSVGALQLRKNTTRLVEAFERTEDKDWKLVLAGAPDGYGAEQSLARIRESTARDRIEVAGYVTQDQLRQLYSTAEAFAFVSLDEGFGIPVLEAMAYGLPVLTSNQSALREVAGGAALEVDPCSTEEITSGLASMMRDGHLREKLRNLGFSRAAEFSWERTVRETYRFYSEIVR